MTDFYFYMCGLFVVVSFVSENLNLLTRFGFGCCIIGFVLSFFMMGFYIEKDVEGGCVDDQMVFLGGLYVQQLLSDFYDFIGCVCSSFEYLLFDCSFMDHDGFV